MKEAKIITKIAMIVFIISIITLATVLVAFSQNNVVKREIVGRDTINAVGFVSVQEYVNKAGKQAYKATWCGKAINVSESAAKDILEGSDAYVVLCRYNNGEIIRNKVITLYSE